MFNNQSQNDNQDKDDALSETDTVGGEPEAENVTENVANDGLTETERLNQRIGALRTEIRLNEEMQRVRQDCSKLLKESNMRAERNGCYCLISVFLNLILLWMIDVILGYKHKKRNDEKLN